MVYQHYTADNDQRNFFVSLQRLTDMASLTLVESEVIQEPDKLPESVKKVLSK